MQARRGRQFFQFCNTEKKGAVPMAADPWRALARAIVAEEEALPASEDAPAFRPGERVQIGPAAPWWWLRGCTGVVVGTYGPQVLVRPDGWEASFACRTKDLERGE